MGNSTFSNIFPCARHVLMTFEFINAMCTFMYLFVVYFSFTPVISASIHRYGNYFDIYIFMFLCFFSYLHTIEFYPYLLSNILMLVNIFIGFTFSKIHLKTHCRIVLWQSFKVPAIQNIKNHFEFLQMQKRILQLKHTLLAYRWEYATCLLAEEYIPTSNEVNCWPWVVICNS